MIHIDPITGDSVPLEDMSRITGLGAFHLQRKFKAALGGDFEAVSCELPDGAGEEISAQKRDGDGGDL